MANKKDLQVRDARIKELEEEVAGLKDDLKHARNNEIKSRKLEKEAYALTDRVSATRDRFKAELEQALQEVGRLQQELAVTQGRLIDAHDELRQARARIKELEEKIPDKQFADTYTDMKRAQDRAAARARDAENYKNELKRANARIAALEAAGCSTGPAGRPVKYGDDVHARARQMRSQGRTVRQIAEALGVSTGTAHKMIKG